MSGPMLLLLVAIALGLIGTVIPERERTESDRRAERAQMRENRR